MTPKQKRDAVLWRVLAGQEDPEFYHNYHQQTVIRCIKCDAILAEEGDNRICRIPDPYPGTDADIAEEIENSFKTVQKIIDWKRLCYKNHPDYKPKMDLEDFIKLRLTPADKINAFISMMEKE